MSKNIYQAKQVRKNGKVYDLMGVSYVFDCPVCEYIITALTKEGAQALEHTHFITSTSIHLDALSDANWDDSPLSALEDVRTKIPNGLSR